jgi:methionyl-tRNA synthetase
MAENYRQLRVSPAGDGGRLARVADVALTRYRSSMAAYKLHDGAAAAFELVDATNEFIAETAPWKLAKDPASANRLDAVLFEVAEAIRLAAVMLLPIMPSSSAEILRRIGEQRPAGDLRLDSDGRWRADGAREIVKGAPLWPRAEASAATVPGRAKEKIVDEKPVGGAGQPAAPDATQAVGAGTTPAEDTRIAIDDFMKVELRTAKVLEAEAVPKSKKLIKMKVEVGAEQRTILAGIAEAYQPDQLVGRTIVIVANLKPAKLMGIESNGMVLAASSETGKPTLVTFDEQVEPGWRVR